MSTKTQPNDVTDEDEQFALDEANETTLPIVEVLTGRGFITGKSGSGKSNSASVLVEELLDRGFPVLIVDTDGEYWGLKESYEILHVGADEECDLQVGPEHAEKLAELALDQDVPIILDVSGYLEESDASALVRETASALFAKEQKLNKPFLLLVEEIHEYLPEGAGSDETAKMLTRVAKRGRKRGLGLCGMSQRPADVKKDFITQCDWLLWHRLTWENDTQVVRRVVDTERADAVQDLADGEAFLMADFLPADVTRVQVRRKRTFDAGATPDLDDYERPELKSVSGSLVDELEAISEQEERRQGRIAELEGRVDDLQAEKAALEEELQNARDMREMASQFAEAMQTSGGDGDVASETVDELIDERNALQKRLKRREDRIEELEGQVADLEQDLQQRPDVSERAVEAVDVLAEEFGAGDDSKWKQKYRKAQQRLDEMETDADDRAPPETDVIEHPAVQRQLSQIKNTLADMGPKQLQMLEWFEFYGPGSLADAYFHAGYKRSSERRYEAAKPLRNADFIEKESQSEFRYALEDVVRETFADNPQIGEDDIDALVRDVEDEFHDLLDEVDDQ